MDEDSKVGTGGVAKSSPTAVSADNSAAANPNSDAAVNANGSAAAVVAAAAAAGSGAESNAVVRSRQSSRTPFTNLSQVDADLALARTLQEQERAYMMLRMNGDGSNYGNWEGGSYYYDDEYDDGDFDDDDDDDEDEYDEFEEDDENEELPNDVDSDDVDGEDVDGDEDEEDAFDVHAHEDSGEGDVEATEIDQEAFPDDEAFARALQDAEEQEMAARLWAMAGIAEREVMDLENNGGNSQDGWEEVDPDELSYEELLALGEVVGTESRGLSADTIASLPSISYRSEKTLEEETDSCVICRLDYEDGDLLTSLPCNHSYHSECINNWLKINKVCPVCSTEVSSSATSS
ncbi:hypothetical protein Dimus_010057 [Dionaea muscipula]